MSKILEELVKLLALERIEENLFRGQSQDLGWGTLFGGHVLGQSLSAAVQTVPQDRRVHSLHAYFLRPGRVDIPVVYEVDRIRDGSSFTTRRVVAIQAGQAIFNMAASFQVVEEGFDHQDGMPDAPPPEDVPTEQQRMRALLVDADGNPTAFAQRVPRMLQDRALAEHPFELRPVEAADDPIHPSPQEPQRFVWLRAAGQLPEDPALHAYLLAYASDFSFVTTALLPHGVSWLTPKMQVASLDHVMWFHRPFRVDDWLLYAIDSPSAHGARGMVRGQVFTRTGVLVASCGQEGLIRRRG